MKRKTVAIAGASGMIGTFLAGYLKDCDIQKISRADFQLEDREFAGKYRAADTIINLAGAPVIKRWTKKYMREILNSRVQTTKKLGCILQHDPGRERQYISASGIGIYDDLAEHTEKSEALGSGFMAEVVRAWEKEVFKLASDSTHICILRIGIVLSSGGGMLSRLIPIFRIGLGASIGKGDQYFSWIHIEDLARAVAYVMEKRKQGIYNLTAPGYATNRELTENLANSINKPAYLAIPEFVFKLLFGRGSEVVTGGQAVVPDRLIREGFQFKYADLRKAMEDIVN
jgi:uncharacterized protein (TIGR01777 family)